MVKTEYAASKAAEAELPKPRPLLWWLALTFWLVAAAALIAGPYLFVAHVPSATTAAKVSTTVTWLVVQPVLLLLTLVLAMYSFGRARIEGSALRGLHVDVRQFTDNRQGATGNSAHELTAAFTRKLTQSRIYSPSALPGTAGSYDLIQVVENAGDAASSSWWKVAARTLRLLRPPAAYRVTGTVADVGPNGSPKLVVELLRLPRYSAAPLIIEDDTWDRVLERAANSVAALIFPRSKMCKNRAQWADWWGYAFPTELFDAYQRAHQFLANRRFDHALAEYHRALRLDPANVYIRLEIAQLQERLSMHIDALVTYDDVVTICSRRERSLAKWWNGPHFGRERSRSQRHRAVALLVARYRHALMLSHGDRIADQWWLRTSCDHEHHWDTRQRQRDYMRALVRRRLVRYQLAAAAIDPKSVAIPNGVSLDEALSLDWHSTLPNGSPSARERAAALRLYLCSLGQYECERLVADYRRLPRWIRTFATRDSVDLVTTRGLKIVLIWAVLRRAMAQAALGVTEVSYRPVWAKSAWHYWLVGLLRDGRWPVDQRALWDSIEVLIPRYGGAVWHDYYNVACTCAVALLPPGINGTEPDRPLPAVIERATNQRTALGKLAISHLHRAAANSHSGFLAQRRSWVLYEDPDLASLRGTTEFRNFEMVTFSPTRAVPLRPHRLYVWELMSYQVQMVAMIARLMQEVWFDRELTVATLPTRAQLNAWYTMEVTAWRQVARVAVSHRDWRTRHETDIFLQQWLRDHNLPGGNLGMPTFTQDGLYSRYVNAVDEQTRHAIDRALRERYRDGSNSIEAINRITEIYIEHCNERMNTLAREIHNSGHRGSVDLCRNAHASVGRMQITKSTLISSLNHGTRSSRRLRRQCVRRQRLWGALADWFDDELEGMSPAERKNAFRVALPRQPPLRR